jgi:apolipoprotein N-acyltransferase
MGQIFRRISGQQWGLAALSGVLQVLPFPIAGPTPLWRTTFCWVALVPLLWALLRAGGLENGRAVPLTVRDGALLGYGCGFVWYLGNCYWIYQTMNLYGGLAKPVAAGILVLFCLYLGLYHALFGALIAAFRRGRFGVQGALLLAPFAWVAVELARARITGLPWDLLGVSQVDNPVLTRMAPITGAYGISFVIAAVNALWMVRMSIRERRWTRPALTVAGVGLVLLYVGLLRRGPGVRRVATTATATLLQENLEVGAANRGVTETAGQMLESFAGWSLHPSPKVLLGVPELRGTPVVTFGSLQGPIRTDLIVWPESPAPFEERDSGFRQGISALARTADAPVIVGNIGIDPVAAGEGNRRGYELHNSASFVTADGSFAGRYDKMHLVPFGEYVPFKRMFFFAGSLLAEVGTFDAGTARRVFATNGHRYGTFICYESIFADEMRQYVAGGADVLVNISNDGWYGNTSAAWQHLNMVRMRAIENHRWVLRATNTGVTAAINPYGRVTAAAPRHVRTAIAVRFGYERDVTFYAAHGDWFAYLCALVTAVGLGWSLRDADGSTLTHR